MTPQHALYIPMVAILALIIGYVLGSRAVRAEYDKQKKRMKE
jgi:hypothetical protein